MPLTAEDKLTITEVLTRVYQGLDDHDGEAYASYFAEDGVLDNNAFGTISGPPAVAAFVNKHCADGHEDGALHCLSNPLFSDTTENETTFRAEVMKFRVSVTPPEPWVSAYVTARMRRAGDGWQVARFTLGIRSAVYQNYEKVGA